MKNSEYWQERFRQLEEAQNRLAQTSFKEIEAQYRAAQKELEGKINTWYQRLAKNNNVSMAEARKLLSANELEEFKWSVWDYIKHGEENALDGQWIKQLENASAKFHISKYQALMIDTRQSFEQMFGKQLGTVTDTMGKVFENGYYKTAYELQKGMGIGFDVGKINREEVENVLSKPWAADGKNFSERIWGNKEKLINEVHTQLTQNIITGADPQKAIDTIAKKMNTSKSNAGRLVMTEEAYFSSAAQEKSYKDLGVEQYEVLATLDSHTSEICQNLDGKVFDMKDYKAGVTAPPFHVRCRSTTVPHLDEELWGDSKGERAARDKDGKTYYVPDDITYPQWKETFVDGDKSGFEVVDKSENSGIIDKNINSNFAKASDVFTYNAPVGKISPQSILDEMEKNEVGKEALRQLAERNVKPFLDFGVKPFTHRGEQQGNSIKIYLSNIPSERVAAQTIIHEATHLYYNIGQCQWAEAICFAKEKMFLTGKPLTVSERRYIISLAKNNYPEFKWKKGGYGYGKK